MLPRNTGRYKACLVLSRMLRKCSKQPAKRRIGDTSLYKPTSITCSHGIGPKHVYVNTSPGLEIALHGGTYICRDFHSIRRVVHIVDLASVLCFAMAMPTYRLVHLDVSHVPRCTRLSSHFLYCLGGGAWEQGYTLYMCVYCWSGIQ